MDSGESNYEEKFQKDWMVKLDKDMEELEKISNQYDLITEAINRLITPGLWDYFNKGVTWFYAINIGTLLWILGSLDNFLLNSPAFMPNKYLFLSAIMLTSISSIYLTVVLGIFYFFSYKVLRDQNMVTMAYNTFKYGWINYRKGLSNLKKIKITELTPKMITDFHEEHQKLINVSSETWFSSWESLQKSLSDLTRLSNSRYAIMPSIILYLIGICSLISCYILLFIWKWSNQLILCP